MVGFPISSHIFPNVPSLIAYTCIYVYAHVLVYVHTCTYVCIIILLTCGVMYYRPHGAALHIIYMYVHVHVQHREQQCRDHSHWVWPSLMLPLFCLGGRFQQWPPNTDSSSSLTSESVSNRPREVGSRPFRSTSSLPS